MIQSDREGALNASGSRKSEVTSENRKGPACQ